MRKRNVPFFICTKKCPLSFPERMIYSWLAWKGKFKAGCAIGSLSRYLGFVRNTIRSRLAQWARYGLVEKKEGKWFANMPKRETEDWFFYPDKLAHLPLWQQRIQYRRIKLLKPGVPFSILHSAVWSLVSSSQGK